jgi:multiple antibiotic resistance protein
MNWELSLNFFAAMLAILNPFGKIPIWTEMTSDKEQKVRRRIGFLVSVTGLILLLIFLLSGKYLLNFFNIDLAAFQIAGGILLLITSISMVQGKITSFEKGEEDGDSVYEVAKKRFKKVIFPLVIPIIAGPGSLTTVIIYSFKAKTFSEYGILSAIVFLIVFIVYLFFLSSNYFEKKVDYSVFTIITRLFGLVLAAIAVQFIIEGIGEAFPNLLNDSSVIKDDLQKNNSE